MARRKQRKHLVPLSFKITRKQETLIEDIGTLLEELREAYDALDSQADVLRTEFNKLRQTRLPKLGRGKVGFDAKDVLENIESIIEPWAWWIDERDRAEYEAMRAGRGIKPVVTKKAKK